MLIRDFNIDLLKYDANADSVAFLDTTDTNFVLPSATTPTRVTTHWKSLIDNIFLNNIESDLILGNKISTISDHFAQLQL